MSYRHQQPWYSIQRMFKRTILSYITRASALTIYNSNQVYHKELKNKNKLIKHIYTNARNREEATLTTMQIISMYTKTECGFERQ